MLYGYCRVSTREQSIERQERNIKEKFPSAEIRKEVYTGTEFCGRKILLSLCKEVKSGDTIVFDSASRMSRNEAEAVELYDNLFIKGINLVFLKEPQINTDIYKQALERKIDLSVSTGRQSVDNFSSRMTEALNELMRDIAREQVRLAFNQAEKEVMDLRQRTKEGIETARRTGKDIGGSCNKGRTLTTKKSIEAKRLMQEKLKCFGGSMSDTEFILWAKGSGKAITRNTFYKYKNELIFDL